MAQKLFHAEVTIHYYFLAEEDSDEQAEAESFMRDAIRDSESCVSPEVNEVNRMEEMLDWDDHDCLVYGDHEGDISLKEAFQIANGKTYEQADEEFKARFKAER